MGDSIFFLISAIIGSFFIFNLNWTTSHGRGTSHTTYTSDHYHSHREWNEQQSQHHSPAEQEQENQEMLLLEEEKKSDHSKDEKLPYCNAENHECPEDTFDEDDSDDDSRDDGDDSSDDSSDD